MLTSPLRIILEYLTFIVLKIHFYMFLSIKVKVVSKSE